MDVTATCSERVAAKNELSWRHEDYTDIFYNCNKTYAMYVDPKIIVFTHGVARVVKKDTDWCK